MLAGVPLGPDPRKHIEGIRQYLDAGYDNVYVHQVDLRQAEFIRFYASEILPRFN